MRKLVKPLDFLFLSDRIRVYLTHPILVLALRRILPSLYDTLRLPFVCLLYPVIPRFPGNDAVRTPSLAVHLAEIACEFFRDLEGSKVPSCLMLGLEHNLPERM